MNRTEQQHEIFYNREYALQHNPNLMGFGATGGFGNTRHTMKHHVAEGDMGKAELFFWRLVQESRDENLQIMDAPKEDSIAYEQEWLDYMVDEHDRRGSYEDEIHFVRPLSVGRTTIRAKLEMIPPCPTYTWWERVLLVLGSIFWILYMCVWVGIGLGQG